MFENIGSFFKKIIKNEPKELLIDSATTQSKDAAKERLHLVLMQDRANVSADFLDLMKQEIIDVIKKYIEVDEKEIDVRLTNQANDDGTNGAPALYANIPILNIKNDVKGEKMREQEAESTEKQEEKSEEIGDETDDTEEVQTEDSEENADDIGNIEGETTEEDESEKAQ